MDPRFAASNVTTLVLVALTLWVLLVRLRGVIESNWPLIYYAGVVAYSTVFPAVIDPAWIYAGVVSALLMRFEFMGGIFLKIVRLIDIIVLVGITWDSLSAMVF